MNEQEGKKTTIRHFLYTDFHFAECLVFYWYAECHCADCRYAECRGTFVLPFRVRIHKTKI